MTALRVGLISRRVHPAHGPGGLERAVHDQALHLTAAGVRVDLVTETPSPDRRAAAEAAFGEDTLIHWVNPGPLPIGRRPGTVILDRITNYPLWAVRAGAAVDPGVDIVHAHGLAGLGVARRRAAGRLQRPYVLGTHGMEEFVVPDRLKRIAYAPFRHWMRQAAAAADRVVVTDEALLDPVARALRVERERLVTIPNAIDPGACEAAIDREGALRALGDAAAAPLLFVSVGRLASNKGFDVMAEALGRARDELPVGWRWVLMGDGPARSEIEAAVRDSGIEPSVLRLGRVDDAIKHGVLSLAHWFVHPTLYEGSSLATLEAMSHHLPVIASRAGGLPDKVHDGETGLLVPPGDAHALAEALRRAPREAAAAWGAAGRRLLERNFTWRRSAEKLVELYAELTGGAAPPC